jgi:transposase
MYWVDAQTGEIVNRRFGRDELIGFLAQRPAGRVALEACGSGHWWARKIKALGHEVVLLHAKFIRPFVQTNKTDAADARAIWTAVQQPAMRTVAAKTEDQQAMLSLHRMRALLVKFRTMQVNQLRGLLYEFGVTFRAGRVAGLAEIRARMTELEDALPGAMICSLQDQLKRIDGLEQDIDQLEKRMGTWQKQEAACRAIAEVPGIGKLTATALVATMGDAKTFKSGREFASFLGLVPRFAAVTMIDSGTPRPSTSRWRLLPFFSPIRRVRPDSFLSQRRFHHWPVDILPSPRDAFKVVILRQPGLPQGFEHAGFLPLEKALVNCARATEALGRQRLPLTARAQHVNDALEHQARILGFAPTTGFAHVVLGRLTPALWNQGFDPLPKSVRHFPCRQPTFRRTFRHL